MADDKPDQAAAEQDQDADQNGNDSASDGMREAVFGTIRDELRAAADEATQNIIRPAIQQATQEATKYALSQGPKLAKNALPGLLKATGAATPGDIAGQALSKGGELLSDQGGISGIAGKLVSKLGGGKGGKKAAATGYGQGRRIMIQQVQYVPVNYKDCFRAWTESVWPEYMHRVNTLDRQIDEDEARYSIGIKGFWFKKNFTAQVQEQVPFKYIVWSTTQGNIKNTGRISFFEVGEDLTLMVLNLDMAPSGLREKFVRGARYHKRGVRSDFHRFAAWLQMRTPDQLLDMEGWLGTIEGGRITQTHEEYVEEHEEEQERAEQAEQRDEEEESDDAFEDEEDQDEEEEEPEDEEEEEPEEDEDEELEEDEEEVEDDEDEEATEDTDEDEAEEEDEEEDEEPEEPEPAPVKKSAKKSASRKKASSSGRRSR